MFHVRPRARTRFRGQGIAGGASLAFDPATFSGMRGQWDASVDDGSVGKRFDSGTGNNYCPQWNNKLVLANSALFNTTASQQPLYNLTGINGKGALVFDRNFFQSMFMQAGMAGLFAADFTLIFWMKNNNTANPSNPMFDVRDGNGHQTWVRSDAADTSLAGTPGGFFTYASDTNLHRFVFSQSGGNMTAYRDAQVATQPNAIFAADRGRINAFYDVAAGNASLFLNTTWGEILIRAGGTSAAELSFIDKTYGNPKWGTAL